MKVVFNQDKNTLPDYVTVNGKGLIMKVNIVNFITYSILLKIGNIINISVFHRYRKIKDVGNMKCCCDFSSNWFIS